MTEGNKKWEKVGIFADYIIQKNGKKRRLVNPTNGETIKEYTA